MCGGTGAVTYYTLVESAEPLEAGGGMMWWFPQDVAKQVDTTAAGVIQTTVPIRSGQQQGFVVDVYNDSNWNGDIVGQLPGGLQLRVAGFLGQRCTQAVCC